MAVQPARPVRSVRYAIPAASSAASAPVYREHPAEPGPVVRRSAGPAPAAPRSGWRGLHVQRSREARATERSDAQPHAGQRVLRSRDPARPRRVGARRSRWYRRSGVFRGAFEHQWRRRRRAVGEPGAVGVREAVGRQTRVAPELFGIQATLLERRVDERLDELARNQVVDDHLEERPRPDRLVQRRQEAADHLQPLRHVLLALDQQVADGPQLLEHVVEVGVVVDQALHLLGERCHVAQQRVDGGAALVEGGQQRLGVDQRAVHLLTAVTEHAGHLVGLGQQVLDLLVALTQGVGEVRHPFQGGTELRVGLVDGLRQHMQRLLDRVDVPTGGGLGDIEERVVDLVRRGALPQGQRGAGPQRLIAARLDLQDFLTQQGVGADVEPALGADAVGADRELHQDVVAVDGQGLDLADVHAGDAHLVAFVDAAGVGELAVVAGLGHQHRHTGEALAHPDDQQRHQDAHQTDLEPVGRFESPHCGEHLPVGWWKSRTVRTGPPACRPLIRRLMSQE